ncbi:hypothetical protein AERO8C_140155 [Aeromonas veronii]|uniref:Uncharacterized protein n=1 Tax=Aeromonas veronii TaxID=654 RepID=A0A653KVX1_AERVE|nr:hypothetical protein AERO8C_140155 [Aeromonas veronii]
MHDVSPSVDGSSVREGRSQRQRDNSIALNEQFLITRYGGLWHVPGLLNGEGGGYADKLCRGGFLVVKRGGEVTNGA